MGTNIMNFATLDTKKKLASLLDPEHRALLISYKKHLTGRACHLSVLNNIL